MFTIAKLALAAMLVQFGTLSGHVDIGPITPAEHVGAKRKPPPEVYKPYRIRLSLMPSAPKPGQPKSTIARLVKTLMIDKNGDFKAKLATGLYMVFGLAGEAAESSAGTAHRDGHNQGRSNQFGGLADRHGHPMRLNS